MRVFGLVDETGLGFIECWNNENHLFKGRVELSDRERKHSLIVGFPIDG